MKDYKLTLEQDRVLNVLSLLEYKSQREIARDAKISEKRIATTLEELENKSLAGCNRTERTNWWFAL